MRSKRLRAPIDIVISQLVALISLLASSRIVRAAAFISVAMIFVANFATLSPVASSAYAELSLWNIVTAALLPTLAACELVLIRAWWRSVDRMSDIGHVVALSMLAIAGASLIAGARYAYYVVSPIAPYSVDEKIGAIRSREASNSLNQLLAKRSEAKSIVASFLAGIQQQEHAFYLMNWRDDFAAGRTELRILGLPPELGLKLQKGTYCAGKGGCTPIYKGEFIANGKAASFPWESFEDLLERRAQKISASELVELVMPLNVKLQARAGDDSELGGAKKFYLGRPVEFTDFLVESILSIFGQSRGLFIPLTFVAQALDVSQALVTYLVLVGLVGFATRRAQRSKQGEIGFRLGNRITVNRAIMLLRRNPALDYRTKPKGADLAK